MSSKRTDIDDSDVHYMYDVEGMILQEIADYYDVSKMTISNRLHPDKKKASNRKWRLEHPESNKEYIKQWRLEHPEYIKEYSKQYHLEHPECNKQWYLENLEYYKQWRLENPDKKKESNEQWRLKHSEYGKESSKKFRLEHPEYRKTWRRDTEKGRLSVIKDHANRRSLGFIELNKPFDGSEGHHIDEEHIIHIPKELHRSIWHNVHTGQGMEEINAIAFEYKGSLSKGKNLWWMSKT